MNFIFTPFPLTLFFPHISALFYVWLMIISITVSMTFMVCERRLG